MTLRLNVTFNNKKVDTDTAVQFEIDSDNDGAIAAILENLENHIKENMLKIKVYFDTKTVKSIDEFPQYPTSNIISSIGGVISLYLGISLVSFFELVDLLIHCIYHAIKKKAW